jgi:predicted transcriptional regulator YdeE
MTDTFLEMENIPAMRVKADMKGKGPAEAMRILESKLPTLKGRKFYGCYHEDQNHVEEYYACVARVESDEPEKMQLETWNIPSGKYVRRKIMNWEKVIRDGQLPRLAREFAEAYDTDPDRFTIEFYRSHAELHLLMPVRNTSAK